jgi:hypothetical protein
MVTNKKHNRTHSHKNKRAFPDEDPDMPASTLLFVYDGKLTINRDDAMAAIRAGRNVKVRHQLRVTGCAVPREEWVAVPDDPLDNLPSE